MRRSFGGGGGGNGGGGMLRSVQRAIRAGGGGGATPEPFSPSANINSATAKSRKSKQLNKPQSTQPLTLSSSLALPTNNNNNNHFPTLINLPKSGAAATAWDDDDADDDDDVEWEHVDVNHEDNDDAQDFVFGTVPSRDEVNYAISALQQVFEPSSHAHAAPDKLTDEVTCKDVENEDNKTEVSEKTIFSSSDQSLEVDWLEPSLNIHSSKMLQPYGSDRVYDAFHLLQSEPSVQRMVFALSSDKAVWDAVLNNDVVKELRGSISQGDELKASKDEAASDDNNNPVNDILSWVFVNTKVKIMQLISKITELANEIFQSEEKKGGKTDPLQEKLKTSLFLSIVVLLIVVVARVKSM